MLVRVVGSFYFVAGLLFEHGYVVQAAPILKWMGPRRGHAKGDVRVRGARIHQASRVGSYDCKGDTAVKCQPTNRAPSPLPKIGR